MTIKLYDAVRQCIRAQLNLQTAQQMLADPVNIDIHRAQINRGTLQEVMYMSIGVLARLDVIDDPFNDEAQASARELIGVISRRLDVDAEDKFGVPLKPKEIS